MLPNSASWRKSSYSSGDGQCVEVADGATGTAMRDTKHRELSTLFFDSGEWSAFLDATREIPVTR